jgi:hypothetical protein
MFAADTVYVVEHKVLFVSVPVGYTWPMSIAFGIICHLKSHPNNSELDKQTLINNSRPKTNLQIFLFCFFGLELLQQNKTATIYALEKSPCRAYHNLMENVRI